MVVSDVEAVETAQPSDGPLDDPAVTAEPFIGCDVYTGDVEADIALAQPRSEGRYPPCTAYGQLEYHRGAHRPLVGRRSTATTLARLELRQQDCESADYSDGEVPW